MSSSKVLVGFLAGAAVGALAGILFAPDKGSETRKKIAGKAGDLRDAVKDKFNALGDTLRNTFNHVEEEAERVGDKISSKVSSAKTEVKNALS